MLFKASAPGSLMLLGEHAVLHGHHALVCAVDKRITVTLSPRSDKQIKIDSALGHHSTSIQQLENNSVFRFVLAVLRKYQSYLITGCDIKIEAEFSDKIGFASSAAVTVATLAVLTQWCNQSLSAEEFIIEAREIVRSVQGLGSGADVAASVLGGIVAYRTDPFKIEKFSNTHPLTVVYSGKKTPTVEVIQIVQQKFSAFPELFKKICVAIDACSLEGIQCLRENNWEQLGKIMNIQQGLMDALGVNDFALDKIIQELRKNPAILGAKISGSGLGDCVVGLGNADNLVENIPVEISPDGLATEHDLEHYSIPRPANCSIPRRPAACPRDPVKTLSDK